ncbi:MAG: hypothetical protein HY465_04835 [Deltaproteobacteria bacterium]|nr:hypothetical protein [Deltaproteobacteria bacterium]
MKMKLAEIMGWLAVLVLFTGCGAIDLNHDAAGWSDDDSDDSSGITDGREELASGRDAYSLSSIPDFTDLAAIDPSLSHTKAIVGTPPAFSSITEDDIDTYFFGNLLQQRRSRYRFSNHRNEDQSEAFYNALAKCELMQKNIWAASTLDQTTQPLCYMKKASHDGVFTDRAGALIQDQEQLFEQEESTKVIRVRIKGRSSEEAPGNYGLVRIKGSRDTDKLFEADILFCDGRPLEAIGAHHIAIASDGAFLYQGSGHHRSGTLHAERQVNIGAQLTTDARGETTFDSSIPKTMRLAERIRGSMLSQRERMTIDQESNLLLVLSATDEEMMLRMENRGVRGERFEAKLYSLFDVMGSNFEDLAFREGAAALAFTAYDRDGDVAWEPVDAQGDAFQPIIGTEYRHSATPRYVTVDDSDLIDIASDAADHFSNEYTSQLIGELAFDYSGADETDLDDDLSDRIGCNEEITHDVVFDMGDTENQRAVASCAFDNWPENICAAAWKDIDLDVTIQH